MDDAEEASSWMRASGRYCVAVGVRAVLPWLTIVAAACAVTVGLPLVGSVGTGIVPFLPVTVIAAATMAALVGLGAALSARAIRYQLRPDEIRYRSGVIARTATSLPYERIQTVSVTSGLLGRLLGVADVSCQSAADESAVILPGLIEVEAEEVREYVLARATSARRSTFGGT